MSKISFPSHLELKRKEFYREMDVQTTNPLKLSQYVQERMEELGYDTSVWYEIKKSPLGEGINSIRIFVTTKMREKSWVRIVVALLLYFGGIVTSLFAFLHGMIHCLLIGIIASIVGILILLFPPKIHGIYTLIEGFAYEGGRKNVREKKEKREIWPKYVLSELEVRLASEGKFKDDAKKIWEALNNFDEKIEWYK